MQKQNVHAPFELRVYVELTVGSRTWEKLTLSFIFSIHSPTRFRPSFRVPPYFAVSGYSTSTWFLGNMYFLPPPIITCR